MEWYRDKSYHRSIFLRINIKDKTMAIKKIITNEQGIEVFYWRIESVIRVNASDSVLVNSPEGLTVAISGYIDPNLHRVMTKEQFIEATLEDGRPVWYTKIMALPEWQGSVQV